MDITELNSSKQIASNSNAGEFKMKSLFVEKMDEVPRGILYHWIIDYIGDTRWGKIITGEHLTYNNLFNIA